MNNNQKIVLLAGIIILAIVILSNFLIGPLIKELMATSVLAQEQNQNLLILKKTDKEYLRQIENDYKKIKEDISAYKIYLSEKQIIGFIMDLEKAAFDSSSKLEIKSTKFPLFNLSLIGSFPNVMKFLGWLENNLYLVNVESVQMRGLTERDLISKQEELYTSGEVMVNLEIKLPLKDNEK